MPTNEEIKADLDDLEQVIRDPSSSEWAVIGIDPARILAVIRDLQRANEVIEKLRFTGGRMANVMFNFKQHERTTDTRERQQFAEMQEEWDAITSALAAKSKENQ